MNISDELTIVMPAKNEEIVLPGLLMSLGEGMNYWESGMDLRLGYGHMYITSFCNRKHDPAMEQWGAERNQALFEKKFNMKVRVSFRFLC